MNTNQTGLAEEYSEPSTFGLLPVAAAGSAEISAVNENLRSGVLLCGTLHGVMQDAVQTAHRAARTHLLATLNLACLLQQLHQQAAIAGVPMLALYKGYKGNPEAQAHAAELTGGVLLPFTYATARNYGKLLQNVQQRMQQEGGMSSAQVVQVLCDHSAAMLAGAYDDPEAATECLWSPYLSAGSLREAYLELAPDKPKLSLADTIDQATAPEAKPDDFETVRALFLSKCGGYFEKLDSYLSDTAPRVRREDREAVAQKLEETAAKLRSMATMPMLPTPRGARELPNS